MGILGFQWATLEKNPLYFLTYLSPNARLVFSPYIRLDGILSWGWMKICEIFLYTRPFCIITLFFLWWVKVYCPIYVVHWHNFYGTVLDGFNYYCYRLWWFGFGEWTCGYFYSPMQAMQRYLILIKTILLTKKYGR